MATPAAGPVPREALEFLQAKELRPSFDYRDVWLDEHARQFTVAKLVQIDVLADVKTSLEEALKNGETLSTWSKRIRPELEAKGWGGPRQVLDDVTGEVRETNLTDPRRLRTVYETNMRAARAAAQWQRIQRTKKFLPYLIYELGPSSEHRPEHVAWHGTCLPADHPFWLTHTPQNDYGCNCRVRQVGRTEFERLQSQGFLSPVLADDPVTGNPRVVQELRNGVPSGRLQMQRRPIKTQPPPAITREWINKRTGAIERVPVGIGPGFDSNPGIAYQLDQQARVALRKLPAWPADIGAKAYAELKPRLTEVQLRDFRRYSAPVLDWVERNAGKPKSGRDRQGAPQGRVQVVGAVTPSVVRWLKSEVGVELRSAAMVVSDRHLAHLYRTDKVSRGGLSRQDIERLPQLLDSPEVVLWDSEPEQQALLYVFSAAESTQGKVVVQIEHVQRQTDEGGSRRSITVNSVTSAGYVQPENLRAARYRVIEEK